MSDLKNFLTTMVTPDLTNPSFPIDFENWAKAIEDNFEKIVSAPYLKGDKGNSIVVKKVDVSSTNTTDESLRDAIISLLETTFKQIIGDEPEIGGVKSIDFLEDNKVLVFYDDQEGTRYISAPYLFLDERRNHIKPGEESIGFIDKTISITGKYSASTGWVLEANHIIPTLYYNEDIRQWCWCVNGEETGIIAQGVKGDNGKDAKNLKIVRGFKEQSDSKIVIDAIYNEAQSLGNVDTTYWDEQFDGKIEEGDIVLAIAYKETEEAQYNFTTVTFGIVRYTDGEYWIRYNDKIDIINIVNSEGLRAHLNTIGLRRDSDNEPTTNVRGLYIPTTYPLNGNMNDSDDIFMLWSSSTDDDNVLNISTTKYSNTYINDPEEVITTKPGDLKVTFDNIILNGAIQITNTLKVAGKTTLNDELEVAKKATLNDELKVAGKTTLNDELKVAGKTTLNDELEVTKKTTLKDELEVTKKVTVVGDILTAKSTHQSLLPYRILNQNGNIEVNALEHSDLGLAVYVNINSQFIKEINVNTDSVPVMNPEAYVDINLTMGYIGYAYHMVNGRSGLSDRWHDPALYRAKTFSIRYYCAGPECQSPVRYFKYLNEEYELTFTWKYKKDEENPLESTHTLVVDDLILKNITRTLEWRICPKNEVLITNTDNVVVDNLEEFGLTVATIESSDLTPGSDILFFTNTTQLVEPLGRYVTINEQGLVENTSAIDNIKISYVNDNFDNFKIEGILDKYYTLNIKYIVILPDYTNPDNNNYIKPIDLDGELGWIMREMFNHPLNPETIDPMYKIMDLNMNGYCERIYGDIPMMTFKMTVDDSLDLIHLTTEGQEEVNISDMRIFPEGHVGYNENDEIIDNPGFKIKTEPLPNINHGQIGGSNINHGQIGGSNINLGHDNSKHPGVYYNGGMVCDLSKGQVNNNGTPTTFNSWDVITTSKSLNISITGEMGDKGKNSYNRWLDLWVNKGYLYIRPNSEGCCIVVDGFYIITNLTGDDHCRFVCIDNKLYYVDDNGRHHISNSILFTTGSDTLTGKEISIKAKYRDNNDRILTFNDNELEETYPRPGEGWSEVETTITIGNTTDKLNFKFIDDLQTVII